MSKRPSSPRESPVVPSASPTNGLLGAIRATRVPSRCWGFEAADFEVEVHNRAIDALERPATLPRVEAVASLHRPDGSLQRVLTRSRFPEPISKGESRRIPVRLDLPAFAGDYEVRFSLHHVGATDVPIPLPLDAPPVPIRVENTIFEAFVELINACNFRCTFCPQTVLQRKQRPMDFDLAVKIVRDLADMGHHHPIRTHLLGEPLLYPRFFDFVDAAHDLGQRISLATNGSRFSERNIEGILRSRLDEMVISLNTPEEELYNEQRGTRVPYSEYISGVTRMVEALVRHGGPPRTRINILYDLRRADDPRELARVRRIANEWIAVVRRVGGATLPDAEEAVHLDPEGTTLMPLHEGLDLQWTIYHNWGNGASSPEHFCAFPWKHLGILVDGEATACCVDTEGEIRLGNVRDQSVAEIWNGPALERIRQGFLRDQAVEPRCARCDVRHDREALLRG